MALGFKLRAQIKKVVQLAVVHNAAGMILIPDRLVPACKINDAEPAHTNEDFFALPTAIFIGTAMVKCIQGHLIRQIACLIGA